MSMVDGSTTITAESDGLDDKALTYIPSRLKKRIKGAVSSMKQQSPLPSCNFSIKVKPH